MAGPVPNLFKTVRRKADRFFMARKLLEFLTMRKLKLQSQVSIDGFIARPDGGNDWIIAIGDKEAQDLTTKQAQDIDLILMGRKMSAEFLQYWENVVDKDKNNPEYSLATLMVNTQKVIFSKTLKSTNGRNARVENGDLKTEVNKLKNQSGKDIIVYGGATFVSNLIKEDLIDEYILYVNPTAIGKGMSIFHGDKKLKLIKSTAHHAGIVVNQYEPLR
jgi:dihydrofolate reductase